MTDLFKSAATRSEGATVTAYHVNDPERYGVVEFDNQMRAISIEEKPPTPKSHWAVTGLYFYDKDVVDIAANPKPSARGELEIADVNRFYLERGRLSVEQMGRGYAWLDTGTPDGLLDAGEFVGTLQKRQGIKINCRKKSPTARSFITGAELEILGRKLGKSDMENTYWLLLLANLNLLKQT